MAYESPIRQYLGQMQTEIENELLVKVSQAVGWIIDKDELTKALLYDRDQFGKVLKKVQEHDGWIATSYCPLTIGMS